ncbi:unnamed protein product [Absidia cylindrospora]
MKFNVIFISMAIGLLTQSVKSAPVDNKHGVAENDGTDVAPYHIDVPDAGVHIDENGVQVDKDFHGDKKKTSDADTADVDVDADVDTDADADADVDVDVDAANADVDADPANADVDVDADPANADVDADPANADVDVDADPANADVDADAEPAATANKDDKDASTLGKRSPLLGNMGGLSVTSEGIDVPEAGVHVGGTGTGDNDLADDDMMYDQGMDKRNGVDVAPMGLHLGPGSGDPAMASASGAAAQLKVVTGLLTKRDGSNDDDGDDLIKTPSAHVSTNVDAAARAGLTAEQLDDYLTKHEQLDDYYTKKRDRIAHSAHHQAASYGNNVPNRYISEDLADAMT